MIRIERLTKIYDDTTVVDAVDLEVGRGELVALVGTSGSGKTTLLRMINRLVEPSSGRVFLDGQDCAAVPAHLLRRRIGYAIQGDGLFPHRNVAENIGAVPRLLGWDRQDTESRVDELLTLFQLDPGAFRDRMPSELSGGQAQRVGVARALAARPEVLLMDEPFGALDPVIRARAQQDLRAIQSRLGTTTVLVTHDMEEAIALGDRIAVMDGGRLVQFATPAEILAHPATAFVAEMVGRGDRALRLLSLETVGGIAEPGSAPGPAIGAGVSLREALAECLWSGRDSLPVERDGQPAGRVTLAALRAHGRAPDAAALAPGPAPGPAP